MSCRGAAIAVATFAVMSHGSAQAQTCLSDVSGGLNCTANDFAVSSVTVTQVLDDGCAFDGDTFTFNGLLNVAGGSTNRYDIGFYIGNNSTSALTGQCSVHIVPNNIVNLDGDTCGDYNGTALAAPVSNVTVTCRDSDNDGFFDLAICTSWDNNAQGTCNGTSDATPGTASKCRCAQVATTLQTPHCTDDPSLCVDDGNVCTTTVCNPRGSGLGNIYGCSNNNNTLPCDDGLFCNGSDTCSGGTCSQHSGNPCAGGGPCSVCNEAADNCNATAGTLCRAAAGVCDAAETCTGSSTVCPADSFSSGNTCRAASGVCDVAETCSGTSANCPANGFSSGNTCRAANGVCDVAETCNGSSANCPADSFSSGNTCRASAGICDVAETCSGSSASCPANAFQPAGTACTSDGNVCTDDVCNGSGTCVNLNNTSPCDDGLFCTVSDVCSGGTCGGSPRDCSDGIDCTADSCDETADSCTNAPNDAVCEDGDICTLNTCEPGIGCTVDLLCGDICRSAGYWSTHSGHEKGDKSINIGQLVLDLVGGVQVCGQSISTSANASSPWVAGLGLSSNLEALCMKTKGVKQRQLYRQMTAAALNCAISSGPDCDTITGRYIEVSYDDCDALCQGNPVIDGPSIGECISQIDCFNNGGQVFNGDCALGTCAEQPDVLCGKDFGSCPLFEEAPQACVRFEDNCKDEPLCNEILGFCPKASPASSPKACNEARHNSCTIDSCN